MEILNNELGKYVIEDKAFKEIAQLACLKIKNIVPAKKQNDFVDININNDKVMTLTVHCRIAIGQDVDSLCRNIQSEINENILLMCGVDCKNINIDIQGFINEKKS